jgi:hypothetical protein
MHAIITKKSAGMIRPILLGKKLEKVKELFYISK